MPVPESEISQVPLENPPTAICEGVLFSEAAQTAFLVSEEIFREPPPVAPSPPRALVQEPLLSVEDFTVEQADLVPSGTVFLPGQATPIGPSTQPPSGLHRFAPIVLDDGKQLPFSQIYGCTCFNVNRY